MTGKLLFNWDALAPDHIPPGDSYATLPPTGSRGTPTTSISIEPARQRNLSWSRCADTWAAYLVNIKTGKIEVDTRRPALELPTFGPRAGSSWQHDVRLAPGGVRTPIVRRSLLPADGGGTYCSRRPDTRRVILKLDQRTQRPRIEHQLRDRLSVLLRTTWAHTAVSERQRDGRLGIIALSLTGTAGPGNAAAGRRATGLGPQLPGDRRAGSAWPLTPPVGAAASTIGKTTV